MQPWFSKAHNAAKGDVSFVVLTCGALLWRGFGGDAYKEHQLFGLGAAGLLLPLLYFPWKHPIGQGQPLQSGRGSYSVF